MGANVQTQPQTKNDVENLKSQVAVNSVKISAMDKRLADVEDKSAGNEQEIFKIKQKLEKIEKTLSSVVIPTPSVTTESSENKTSQPQSVINISDEDMYKQAFSAMETGDIETAKSIFTKLVQEYPKSSLADNALYWIGEIYYSHNDYQTASNYFERVMNQYPNANKVPASMLKLGMCYKGMGNLDKAKQYFNMVIQKYPDSPEAAIARTKLLGLGQ